MTHECVEQWSPKNDTSARVVSVIVNHKMYPHLQTRFVCSVCDERVPSSFIFSERVRSPSSGCDG